MLVARLALRLLSPQPLSIAVVVVVVVAVPRGRESAFLTDPFG